MKLRFGILGCGAIAGRFAQAAMALPQIDLAAAAARNPQKADAFAARYGIQRTYTDYYALLKDPNVDAVYIALPHKLHARWAIEALQNQKAVLCEKPVCLNVQEMEAIIQAARQNNTLFMEAMKTRFIPAFQAIVTMIKSGMIGRIREIEVSLGNDFTALKETRPDHYIFDCEQGGSLYDGGCYALNYFMVFLKGSPRIVSIRSLAENGADTYVEAHLQWPNGVHGILYSASDRDLPKTARIQGDKGEIRIDNLHRPTHFVLKNERDTLDFDVPYDVDDMYSQIEAFYLTWAAGLKENPIMGMQDSLEQIALLARLRTMAVFLASSSRPDSL